MGEDEESHINKEGSKLIHVDSDTVNLYGENLMPEYLKEIDEFKFKQFDFSEVDNFLEKLPGKPFVSDLENFSDEYNPFDHHDEEISVKNYWYREFSIFHHLYYLLENNHYKLVESIDWNRICARCL